MDEGLLESMVQDEEAEQEMLVVEEQEQSPPQMDSEPEMGAGAANDTSPPPLHQNRPDPGRVGSAECTRYGSAIRNAGTNAKTNGNKHV